MGLFGSDFMREGPGVPKDAPEKNRFFLFFELLGRKLSKLVSLNVIFVIALLPIVFGLLLSVQINPEILHDNIIDAANLYSMPLFIFTGDIIGFALVIISIFITGPAFCGATYVTRNMQRQEHAWVFSDFFEHFRKNYLQGLIMSIIDIFGALILYIAYCYYSYSMPLIIPGSDMLANVAKYIIVAISLGFVFMHYYIFLMIVTFDMKIKDILKNGAIFALAKLPLNIFITVILILVAGISVYFSILGIIAALIITIAFMSFFTIYCVYPTIETSMIDVANKIALRDNNICNEEIEDE